MTTSIIEPEEQFLRYAGQGGNAFLTGPGGVGKTYTLRRFIDGGALVDVTAPTGVAAINVGGSTIHRFCGMLLGPSKNQGDEDYYQELVDHPFKPLRKAHARIQRCSCLVIDEISMLPGRQLDFVNFLFKRIRGVDKPFGGVQVIVTGDFLQLPPVRTNNFAPYDWAFQSRAWEEGEFKVFQLHKIRRQDEPDFVRALCELRVGRMSHVGAKLLMDRVIAHPDPNIVRLFTHNLAVEKWNNLMLGDLEGTEKIFRATTDGPESEVAYLTKNLLTPSELRLKVGAQVAFTVNKYNEGATVFVNGQRGIVRKIHEAGCVEVESAGVVIPVMRHTWYFDPRRQQGGSFTQLPLRLAYALSIHKAQGLTMDTAYIDIRAAREPGQAYTACSRVRTLAGLHFKEWPRICFTSDAAVKFYQTGASQPPDMGAKLVLTGGNP